MPLALIRALEMPHGVRLEFAGDVAVEVPSAEYERQKHNKEWLVSFPQQSLRVL